MLKWLRSWFAWRFSLRRLVIATVFLGAFVGLNLRKIGPMLPVDHVSGIPDPTSYWGWPLPVLGEIDLLPAQLSYAIPYERRFKNSTETDRARLKRIEDMCQTAYEAATSYRLPWSHQAYHILRSEIFRWLHDDSPNLRWQADSGGSYVSFRTCAIIDGLFALIILFLILFLQIPRRKPPDEAP